MTAAEALAAALDPRHMFTFPDPYPLFAAARDEEPVAAIEVQGRRTFVVTRYDDVLAVLSDQTSFEAPALAAVVLGRSRRERLAGHARVRTIGSRLFTSRSAEAAAPLVERVVHRLLDRLAGRQSADLVADLSAPLGIGVLGELLGLPAEHLPELMARGHELIGAAQHADRGSAAAHALSRYLTPIVRARRAAPGEDLISRFVSETVDGVGLTDVEVTSFLQVLLPAGADPPMQLGASMLLALLGVGERFERVGADRTLVPWAVEETLRWETPIVFVVRQTTRPAEVCERKLPAHARVYAVLGSANRDERHYPAAERFDLDRRPADHLSFSLGRHYCIGAHLARLEARTALDAVLDRFPRLRLDPGAPAPAITGATFRWPHRLPVRLDG